MNEPIWIDPRYYDQYRRFNPHRPDGTWGWVETITTTGINTQPLQAPAPVDEERIRKIVREEIADLPIPFDVPDAPPEPTDG